MRIKKIKMLTIDELDEDRRQQEIQKRRDQGTEYNWWEDTIDMFAEEMKDKGFDIISGDVQFNLYHQSRTAFAGHVDEVMFLEQLDPEAKQWPLLHLLTDEIDIDIKPRDIGRYNHGIDIDFGNIEEPDQGIDDNYEDLCIAMMAVDKTVETQLEEFTQEILLIARDHASKLFETLEQEYEYLTSDEYILEDIRANEEEFEGDEIKESEVIQYKSKICMEEKK